MIETYTDDSLLEPSDKVKDDLRICVVAGWFGDASAWREVESRWEPVLRREGIREFKSSDCWAGGGEFRAMGPDHRAELRAELRSILLSSRIVGAATLMTFETEAPKYSDYAVAMFYCLYDLTVLSGSYPRGERVAYLVDQRAKGSARGTLEKIRQKLREEKALRPRIGPACYDDSAEVLPIQAADLLAHVCLLQRRDELNGLAARREFVEMAAKIPVYRPLHVEAIDGRSNLVGLRDLFYDAENPRE